MPKCFGKKAQHQWREMGFRIQSTISYIYKIFLDSKKIDSLPREARSDNKGFLFGASYKYIVNRWRLSFASLH
jgi:hypothetical protein